jgi:hypothetical protein
MQNMLLERLSSKAIDKTHWRAKKPTLRLETLEATNLVTRMRESLVVKI